MGFFGREEGQEHASPWTPRHVDIGSHRHPKAGKFSPENR
jgi:hypothetical protein